MSAFAITAHARWKIVDATFHVRGTYSNGWALQCDWKKNGDESLGPADLVALISPHQAFDPHDLLPALTFSSASASLSPDVECSFECVSSINWDKPFGVPVGLAIDGLRLLFQYTRTNSPDPALLIQASGVLQVDGNSVNVQTDFIDFSPALILVDRIATLSLHALFKQFGLDMPTNFIDLSFADSRIYYAQQDVGQDLKLGLNVTSQLTLTLATVRFPTMDIGVSVASGNGMMVRGQLEHSVDLAGFLTLTGANASYTGGPELLFDSQHGKRTCKLVCGLKFLNVDFGLAGIELINQAGNTSLAATLSYPGTLGPFSNPSLSMAYSDATGFQITNWPAFEVGNQTALDFAKLLRQVNDATGCGKLADFVCSEVTTNFTVSPYFSSTKPMVNPLADGQFYLVLNGYYTISAAKIVVCTVSLPTLALSFTSPEDFSFDSIIDKVGELIVTNGVQVVEQLYNDQQALAKFIAVFVGKKVAQRLAQGLCDTQKVPLEKFLDELADDAGSTLQALGSAGSAILSLLGSGSSCSSGGSSGGDSPNIAPLDPPQFVSSSLSGKHWTVEWSDNPDAIYYVAQLYGAHRVPLGVKYIQTNSWTHTFEDFLSPPYTLSVAAYAFPGFRTNSQFSHRTLRQLRAPDAIDWTIDYQRGVLLCSFVQVANASDYTATVVDAASNAPLKPPSAWPASGEPALVAMTFNLIDLWPFPQQYKIGVIANGGEQYIPSPLFYSPAFPIPWGVGYAKAGVTFSVS